jgi:hypothetical protein
MKRLGLSICPLSSLLALHSVSTIILRPHRLPSESRLVTLLSLFALRFTNLLPLLSPGLTDLPMPFVIKRSKSKNILSDRNLIVSKGTIDLSSYHHILVPHGLWGGVCALIEEIIIRRVSLFASCHRFLWTFPSSIRPPFPLIHLASPRLASIAIRFLSCLPASLPLRGSTLQTWSCTR